MLEQLRRDAVRRVSAGENPEFAAEGIKRRTIYRWLAAYHFGGEDALAAKPIPGAPPKLEQMANLSRMIRDKTPLQFEFEFALWTGDHPRVDQAPISRELERGLCRTGHEAHGLYTAATAMPRLAAGSITGGAVARA